MKCAVIIAALAAVAALAAADCAPTGSGVTSTSTYVNQLIKIYMCATLESSCIHPDPQAYQALYGLNYSIPWYESCTPFGENALTATENGVSCTVTPTPNNGTCAGLYTVSGDLSVYLYYTPCYNWWGTVTFSCRTYRQGDDWLQGDPSFGNITVGTWQFTSVVSPVPCNSTTCINGYCSLPDGCQCDAGWTGPDCNVSGAAQLLGSAILALIAAVLALVFNL